MTKPTDDIQYLRGLPNSTLIERARDNPTAQLAIVLAERLRPYDDTKRVAPNHPAFLGA